MDQLSGMQLFVRVADTGSFSRAARAAGVSQSTVSKTMAGLEQRLGAQLLRRTTRGMTLTDAGREYYAGAVDLLSGIEAVEARIGEGQVMPSGLLRVALSSAFGRRYVIPAVGEFVARYPEVTFAFDASERHANLAEGGIDLAFRVGVLADSSLIARRLGAVRLVTVATPGFLLAHSRPRRPADLTRLPGLVYHASDRTGSWVYATDAAAIHVEPRVVLWTNDPEHLRVAAVRGLGIAQCPEFLVADDIASGTLTELLTAFEPPAMPLSALSSAGRRQPKRAQLFVDFLAARFATIPELNADHFRPRLVVGHVSGDDPRAV